MFGRTPLQAFWFALGCLALVLGGIGVVLPVLPTTPFVLLAVIAFSKSAPTFEKRLRNSRLFGPMIDDWQRHGAIALRYKVLAHAMMAGALGVSVAYALPPFVLVLQAVCMCGASYFILTRPNRPG